MGLFSRRAIDLYRYTLDGRRVYGVPVLFGSGDWWAWLGLLMFGACAVMMARGIRMVRRARRRRIQGAST